MTPELTLIAAEREKLARVRKRIADLFGGMGAGSAVWGHTQYDKGWSNGIQAALGVVDEALALIESKVGKEKP